MVQFVEKRASELFDKIKVANLPFSSMDLPTKPTGKYTLAAITSKTENQGISVYVEETPYVTKLNNCITIASNGDAGTAFYQTKPFTILQDSYAIKLKDKYKPNNKDYDEIYLYFTTLFNKIKPKYGWHKKAIWERESQELLQVPVTATGALDTDYMASYVRKIEASYVRKIEAYLSVLGYKSMADVKLTKHEQKLLAGGIQAQPTSKFRVGDLFDVLSSNSKINALAIKKISALPKSNLVPYVVRTSLNNGIKGYIDIQQYQLNDANTFSFAQDTAEIFYQTKPYVTGDKIKLLVPKNKLNYKQALFLLTAIRKAFSLFQWGSSSFSENVIKLTYIILPVTSSGDLDWQFMEDYITAIEKLKVLKLKQFLDHKLDLYQQAIQ